MNAVHCLRVMAIATLGWSTIAAQAGLSGRDLDGDASTFEAYYDNVLDITWLRDANLAASQGFGISGISASGAMSFPVAQQWVAAMNAANYLGQSGWRLPTLSPIAGGTTFSNSFTNNASTDVGTATALGWVDGAGRPVSEMGHMYYVNLGNLGRYTPGGGGSNSSFIDQPGWGLANTGSFVNVDAESHWTGVIDGATANRVYFFIFSSGSQSVVTANASRSVWAVHDGSVGAVPEASTFAMFGAGLLGLAWARRRALVWGKGGTARSRG